MRLLVFIEGLLYPHPTNNVATIMKIGITPPKKHHTEKPGFSVLSYPVASSLIGFDMSRFSAL